MEDVSEQDTDEDTYGDAFSVVRDGNENTCAVTNDDSTEDGDAPPLPPRNRDRLQPDSSGEMQRDIAESSVQLENTDDMSRNVSTPGQQMQSEGVNSFCNNNGDGSDEAPPLPPRLHDQKPVDFDVDIQNDIPINTMSIKGDQTTTSQETNNENSFSCLDYDSKHYNLDEVETRITSASKNQTMKNILFNRGIFHHIECRDDVTLRECISRGANVNFENENASSLCPIHFAAKLNSVQCLRVLIENNAQIDNQEKRKGDTALHIAAQYGSKECMEILLKEDAFVDFWNRDHWTPLHIAAFYGNDECLEILLKSDANVEAKTMGKGSSPLHLAAQENHFRCLHLLLEHGADVESRMKIMSFTPLHLAARAGHLESVKILVKYGSNRSSKIITGMTALDFADLHGHERVKELLQNVDLAQMDFRENGLPKEIRVMDNLSANKLQVLMKDGWFRIYEARYLIVGEYGVGKTTLAKALVGEKISSVRQATESIDLYVGRACLNVEEGTWCCHDELLSPEDVAFHRLLMYTQSTDTVQATYQRQLSERTRTMRQTRKSCKSHSLFFHPVNEPDNFQYTDDTSQSVIKRNTSAGLKEATSNFWGILTHGKDMQSPGSSVEIKINKDRLLRKTVKACKRNLHRGNKAPVYVWDFGGQDVFYTTHQTFLSYRGIYLIVVDGSRDIDDLAPGTESLPGCSDRLTTRRYLRLWINLILTYSKMSVNGFPKIMVISSHCDKVSELKRKEVREKLFNDIQEEFRNQDAIKHLVLQHKFFVDTRHISEHQLTDIKTALVDLAINQPYWGERMPKRFIHLEMELLSLERNKNILTVEELHAINQQNPLGPLDENDLEMFLHLQHSMGRIIHFPVAGLNEHIILNPVYLIDAFRSIITDKTFCENDPTRQDLWKNMNEHGVISKSDIKSLWSLSRYGKFNKHKSFLTSLMVHLDFIADPCVYISGSLVESEIYLVPCMISNIAIICWPPKDFDERAITFSFRFQRSFLPPAIAYRFLTACVSLWSVVHEGGQSLLSSGFAVVNIDRSHRLSIQCNESRIVVSLIHCSSKHLISPGLASGLKDSLNDILENICDVYANAFEDGSRERCNIVYRIELGCCKVEPCFTTPKAIFDIKDIGKDTWFCPGHKTRQHISLVLRWFAEKEVITCENCEGISENLLSIEVTDQHLCKLSTQFSIHELKEFLLHLHISHQEWADLEYLNENAEIVKIRALLMMKNKRSKITFGELKKTMYAADFNVHKMCEMTRTTTLDKDIGKSALLKIPTDQDLDEVVSRVGAKSLHIAIHLGFSLNEWEDLKTANPKSLFQLNRSILTLWKDRSCAKPTLQMLAEALLMIHVSPDFLF